MSALVDAIAIIDDLERKARDYETQAGIAREAAAAVRKIYGISPLGPTKGPLEVVVDERPGLTIRHRPVPEATTAVTPAPSSGGPASTGRDAETPSTRTYKPRLEAVSREAAILKYLEANRGGYYRLGLIVEQFSTFPPTMIKHALRSMAIAGRIRKIGISSATEYGALAGYPAKEAHRRS